MSRQPAKDLTIAIWDIEDMLTACPTEYGGNVWDRLVRICNDGSIDQRFVEPVQKQIPEYIANLSETEKREIWSQTETGQMNSGDSESWDIQGIEVDLENELLAEVLDQAFRQAHAMKSKRKKRRTNGFSGRSTAAEP